MHYKTFIRQWKHKLKDDQFFVARELAQSGKQDETFWQVLSYASDLHSTIQVVSRLHATVLGKSSVV